MKVPTATDPFGWLPGGRGVISETITRSRDGKSFTFAVTVDQYEENDALIEAASLQRESKATQISL
jgi:hypothetical protein